jgi:hypothetical protein
MKTGYSLESNSFKRCVGCNVFLPIDDFYNNNLKKRDYTCKKCKLKENRIRYKKPIGRFSCYRRSAKGRGIPFKITFEEFILFWNKPCTYCGEIIVGIGLDRMDSYGSYTLDNICSCCTSCNIFKRRLGSQGFIDLCIKVAKNNGGF